MSSRRKKVVRRTKKQERQTNWIIIGGVIAVGVVALFVLLALSLSEGDTDTETETSASLAEFCADNEANCVSEGSSAAPVTIVEVSDYGCGHCKNFNLDTADLIRAQYVDTGQVRWITLPFALGDQTAPAAEASLCAADQERFPEFHKTLFEQQENLAALTFDGFKEVAQSVGLNMESFNNCYEGRTYASQVSANRRIAAQAGVAATPSFFINGELLEGNRPLSLFQQQIDLLLGS